MSESKNKAYAKYQKEKCTGLYLKLNKETDRDIIQFLEVVGNKQGTIKRLIREEIKQNEKYDYI